MGGRVHRLFVVGVSVLVAGCTTYGVVYVGQPQLFTRERLVGERLSEKEWLETQREQAGRLSTTYQGRRELREFAGFYNELKGSFDPTQGALKRTEIDNQDLAMRTEAWRLRTAEHEAQQAYLNAIAGTPGPTNAATTAATPIPTLALPTSSTPLSDKTPLTGRAAETASEASFVDVFNDRKSARDTVNAALKDVQLDDTHDLFGSALYEMLLDLTVVPGSNSSLYAQINLNLEPSICDQKRLRRLFPKWHRYIQARVLGEIEATKQRFVSYNASAEDVQLVESFFSRGLAIVISETSKILGLLERARQQALIDASSGTSLSDDTLDTLNTLTRSHRLHGLAGLRIQSVAVVPDLLAPWIVRYQTILDGLSVLRRDTRSCPFEFAPERLGSREGRCGDRLRMIPRAIEWAIWAQYAEVLAVYVDIEPPPALLVNPHASSNDTGEGIFVRRLCALEQRLHTFRAEPKEYAQNISEVSARESMANLILAVQAVLPAQGANVQDQAQYVRRSQELVDAISRQPLAIGFSQGGSAFGWLLGPRFSIRAQDPWVPGIFSHPTVVEYLHTPARHTFSAAIVAPAWWTKMGVTGHYAWIDGKGVATKPKCLWGGDAVRAPRPVLANPKHDTHTTTFTGCQGGGIKVLLPYRDPMRAVTNALLNFAGEQPADSFALRTQPKITYPRGTSCQLASQLPVTVDLLEIQAGPGAQSVLIRGQELWRNPQVFVGSQKAKTVEVLADMNGLLARFENLAFPGGRDLRSANADLRVVTSFGEDCKASVVTILAPPEDVLSGTGSLKTHFVDGSEHTRLVFDLKRPPAYSSLVLKTRDGGSDDDLTVVSPSIPEWHNQGTEVRLPYPAEDNRTRFVEVDLLLKPRGDSTTGETSLLAGGPTKFVNFASEYDRLIVLDTTEVVFDKNKATEGAIDLRIPANLKEEFYYAYPGLARSIFNGDLVLSLLELKTGNQVAELRVGRGQASEANLRVPKEELNRKRASMTFIPEPVDGEDKTTGQFDVSIVYRDEQGMMQVIKTRNNEAQPAAGRVQFKQLRK